MELKEIKVSDIRISGLNPRKTFDEASIKELAENIRRQGLIQPVTVRPVCEDEVADGEVLSLITGYELVCGERRFRAVKLLGRARIACYVKEMTDDEAFDAMITENLQRKDVEPLDEAFAFLQLTERGQKAEDIAARFGKSARFVQDRIKLNALTDGLKQVLKDGRIPLSGALMLSKLGAKDQDEFLEYIGDDECGKDDISGWIDDRFMVLDNAVWNGDDNVKPCRNCECNTSMQGCLFYEMKGERAKCTDRECFEKKGIDYILWKLEHSPEHILRADEEGTIYELTKKKYIPLIIYPGYNVKGCREKLTEAILKAGYKVYSPGDGLFRNMCYYGSGDSRTKDMLLKGEIFKVIVVHDSWHICYEELYYWVPKNVSGKKDVSGNVVDPLVCRYKRNEEIAEEKKYEELRYKLRDWKFWERGGELDPAEKEALSVILYSKIGWDVKKKAGLLEDFKVSNMITQAADVGFDKLVRIYIADNISGLYGSSRKVAYSLIDDYKPGFVEDYDEEAEKALVKKQEKIRARLAELGYDVDGSRLKDTGNEEKD